MISLHNSEIIRLLKSDTSILPAVKYVKEVTGWMLKECKEYVEKVRDKMIAGIGTITWFRCEDQLPPIEFEQDKTSKYVLIWQPGLNPTIGQYNYEIQSWLHYYHWQPTHWAYVNYPHTEEAEREDNGGNDATIIEIFKG